MGLNNRFLVRTSMWMVFLSTSLPSLFATELLDAQATVDEVVADTNFLIPLTRTPIPFENFRYPYIDPQGNVLFVGNDYMTFGAEENSGIYRSSASDGTLLPLVKEEQLSPDDGKPVGAIMGLQTDFKSIVFHRGPDHGIGIYGLFDGGPLVSIANLQTRVPEPGVFEWFWYGDVSNGHVVFNAAFSLGNKLLHGLYLYRHEDKRLWRLIDETQPVPVANGVRLSALSYQPRIDPSWLVFSANATDPTGNEKPGRGILGWPLTSGAGMDEKTTALNRLQILAPFGMIIPESGGRVMTSAPNPVVDHGLIAVVAGSDPKLSNTESTSYASICVRTLDGVWHNPIDTDTLIPGRNDGATFTGFNKWVAVQDGQVIFRAYGTNSYQAIFLYQVESNTLYFVADTARKIDGKAVQSYEVSTHPLAGQRLAMMVRFRDKTSGEYLATLPGLPVTPERKPAAFR